MNLRDKFSTGDMLPIAAALDNAITDLEVLQRLISDANTIQEVQQKHDLIKRWLTMVCDDLAYIAGLIDLEAATTRMQGKIQFKKVSGQGGGQKASLEDLLNGSGINLR